MSIIRQKLAELEIINMISDNRVIDKATSYFDRRTTHSDVRQAVKQRYGLSIRKVEDKHNPKANIETYVREETEIQVDAGIFETVSVGFGQKIIGAVANLFTEPGQSFSLTHPTIEGDKLEKANELLTSYRKQDFRKALAKSDKRSIQVGSCAIALSYTGGALERKTHTASRMRFYYPESIIETVNGITVTRAPNKTDIEDCYQIVMNITTSDETKNGYLAIMGRSVDWPQGRYVQYTASEMETAVPAINDDSIIFEYEHLGAPANPLSVIANENLESFVPEYPIVIIKGLVADDETPMPVSMALYEDSIEFDVAASHILGKSQEAAGGANVLSLDQTGEGKPLPRTLSSDIVLQAGQSLEHVSKSANDADTAYETTKKEMVDAGAGYGVPDFYMSSDDHTLEAASGVALKMKTIPLEKQRNDRIEENSEAVEKMFEIEKWLIVAHDLDADDSVVNILKECSQIWQPGEIILPQNKIDLMAELTSAKELGLLDTIAEIKKYHQLSTDAEAIAMYELMKKRNEEYPPIQVAVVEPVKKTTSLLGSLNNVNS